MKQIFTIAITMLVFSSCKKDNDGPLVCMECIDKNGNVVCQPFKQTKSWSIANTSNEKRYHILPIEDCR